MALTNAKLQARYRKHRQGGDSRVRYRRPADGGRGDSSGARASRRAALRYAPTRVGSAATTTKSASSPRTAARAGRPRRARRSPAQTLLALHEQYQAWQDALPESLAGSATGRCSSRFCNLQADVFCDRLLHDAHRIELKGRSMRRDARRAEGPQPEELHDPARSWARANHQRHPRLWRVRRSRGSTAATS